MPRLTFDTLRLSVQHLLCGFLAALTGQHNPVSVISGSERRLGSSVVFRAKLGPDGNVADPVLTLQADELPPWLLDYMYGAGQELYKLPHFPSALVGRTVKEAARFIFDCCHGVLLAVEPTQGPQQHKMMLGDMEQVGPVSS